MLLVHLEEGGRGVVLRPEEKHHHTITTDFIRYIIAYILIVHILAYIIVAFINDYIITFIIAFACIIADYITAYTYIYNIPALHNSLHNFCLYG